MEVAYFHQHVPLEMPPAAVRSPGVTRLCESLSASHCASCIALVVLADALESAPAFWCLVFKIFYFLVERENLHAE